MKLILPLLAAALGLAAQAALADEPKPQPSPGALPEAQVLEQWGWFIANGSGLSRASELKLTPEQLKSVLKGIEVALKGGESPYDIQKVGPQMDSFVHDRLKEVGRAAASDFFTKLASNKSVLRTPTGLRYEVLEQGAQPFPAPTDTVKVNYTGKLLDGTVFDSSYQARQQGEAAAPAEFQLNKVIPGWTEGLQKIGKGGKIRLYIPSDLAYGDEGNDRIPPASALIFEVELLDIKSAAK